MGKATTRRPLVGFAQAGVYTIIVLAILVVLNFLANRYNKSFDTTANKRFTLSDQTAKNRTRAEAAGHDQLLGSACKVSPRSRPSGPLQEPLTKIDVEYNDIDKKRTQAMAAGIRPGDTLPKIIVESGARKQEAKSLTEEEITGAMVRALKTGQRTVCFVTGSGEHLLDKNRARRILRRQGID